MVRKTWCLRTARIPCSALALGILLFSIVSPYGLVTSAAECFTDLDGEKSTLREALKTCQQQIEETEKILQQQQADRTNTEYDILLIDQEINKSLLRIRSSDIIIGQLKGEITNKGEVVENLNDEIVEQQTFLVELLQRINEAERKGFLSILLSNVTISSFFQRTNEYESLRSAITDSIQNITNLKLRLVASVDDLEEKKTEQGQIRQQQRAAANQVQYQKQQKKVILNQQVGLEKETQQRIDEYETRASQIRNRLFEFYDGGGIPFDQALAHAEEVERRTGVRAAFLLGVLKHESDLGRNVGTGTYKVDMHPTRDQPIFPYIAKLFGFEPEELKVSADPGYGWGGAMGPAQFIPSTWVCYGGLVNSRTGKCALKESYIKTTTTLQIGSSGADVKRLQQFLNQNGFTVAEDGPGSRGNETSQYGHNVARAVTKFQERYASRILQPYGYTRGTGKVGPSTRSAINQLHFYSGPWQYRASEDIIRKHTRGTTPSNPWSPRDAFFASGIYLSELGAARDECTAARWYYAGGNWRSNVALRYCQAVVSNARLFQRDIDYLKQ